jgi:hypothetical protein
MHRLDRDRISRRTAIAVAALAAGAMTRATIAQDSTPSGSESEIAPQLPAADLPTMNEQGFTFELESSWTGSFDSVATEAPVYQLIVPTFDQAAVEELASRLGIEGEVQDQGGGTYMAEGNGSLFVSPGLQQYISNAEIPDGDLPSDDEAIAYAREWLRQIELLPANAGTGFVSARIEEPARVIVTIPPLRPENLITSYPAIQVTMGPNAVILEAAFRWADLSSGDIYALLPVETAWTEVAERRSYLQADVPADAFEAGATISGSAAYDTVVIAYTSSGVPGQTQYLQPVYQFNGSLTPEGGDATWPITAYVPALINSQQPVG